jgi:hypothetical protein
MPPDLDIKEVEKLFQDAQIAIATMIHQFAQLEISIILAFRFYLDVPDEVARAIAGDGRITDTIATFRRVAEAKSMNDVLFTYLDQAFRDIAAVKKFRDCAAHRTWHIADAKPSPLIVFTYYESTRPGDAKYSLKDLSAINREIIRISTIMYMVGDWLRDKSYHPNLVASARGESYLQKQALPKSPDQQKPVRPPKQNRSSPK